MSNYQRVGTFWWFFVFAFLVLKIDSGEKWSHDCVESGRLLLRSTNSASHKLSWVDLIWWLKSTHRFPCPDPGASQRIYVEIVAKKWFCRVIANSRSLKSTPCNVRPPFDSVQLVNITPMSLWFFWYANNYSYWGESKPTERYLGGLTLCKCSDKCWGLSAESLSPRCELSGIHLNWHCQVGLSENVGLIFPMKWPFNRDNDY